MKFHSLYLLAPVLFQPSKRKFSYSKSFVDLSTDGINDDESIATRSTSPARDGVVPGKLHIRVRAFSDHRSDLAKFFSDEGPHRFPSIDGLNWIITELGPGFLRLGENSL